MIISAQLQLGTHQTHHLIQPNLSTSEKTSFYPTTFFFFSKNNVNPLPTVTVAIWRCVLKSKSSLHKQFPSWSATAQCSHQERLQPQPSWVLQCTRCPDTGNTGDLHNWERSSLEVYLFTYIEVKVKMKSIMKFLWAYFWFPTAFLRKVEFLY